MTQTKADALIELEAEEPGFAHWDTPPGHTHDHAHWSWPRPPGHAPSNPIPPVPLSSEGSTEPVQKLLGQWKDVHAPSPVAPKRAPREA